MFELSDDGAGGTLVFSATDLVEASECEYGTLCKWERIRYGANRVGSAPVAVDPMLARAAELGDVHERRVLDTLRGIGTDPAATVIVHEVARGRLTRTDLAAKHQETLAALSRGVDVVYQGTFFDGEFLGYADFLVRQSSGRYAVWDSKLARHAKVGALLQLAAYADQLIAANLAPDPEATLVLGDLRQESFHLRDLVPVFRERRHRFKELLRAQELAGVGVDWMQSGLTCCGRCADCRAQIERYGDLLLVWGMRLARRKKFLDQGVRTIRELAQVPEDARASAFEARLCDQARMQLRLDPVHGERTYVKDGQPHTVAFKVLTENTLDAIPAASPGDIFFDFEGDPFWQDPVTGQWGLEYLFGVIESPIGGEPARFRAFWAHDRNEERQAFLSFLAYVEQRRLRWPDMHVYHYAPYEKTALRRLSLMHVAGEDVIDDWLRKDVLVDLYSSVRNSLRISERSYSLKMLEPLYMGVELRQGDVVDAAGSIAFYQTFCEQRDAGDPAAAETLAAIEDYNKYDCVSTLRLREWLGQLREAGQSAGGFSMSSISAPTHPAAAGVAAGVRARARRSTVPQAPSDVPTRVEPPAPEEARLRAHLDRLPVTRSWTAAERAVSLVAAATGYHRRERKQFWWGHFDRLGGLVEDWADTREVFVVESARVLSDWAPASPRARTMTRTVELRGTASEGSDFRRGSTWCRVYDPPLPGGLESPTPETGRAGVFGTEILSVQDGDPTTVIIQERSTTKVPPCQQVPIALTPDQPIPTKSIEQALARLAGQVADSLPGLPRHPGLEILQRQRPRFHSLDSLPQVSADRHGQPDYVRAISAAVRDLDYSYIPVQGPPGTGKTYVGAHVVAELVGSGWKVGVVSQSHAAVDNLLKTAIRRAGVDPRRVGKKLKNADDKVPWTITDDTGISTLLDQTEGCLIGGTTWTMTGRRVPLGCLDLLVIEEAGQYSLANLLAVAQASSRLLLLGDPQQLPQVTQATHPEPVDESALGWLLQGRTTVPEDFGYFLADSWRMHPDLCAAVSHLAYEGKLRSAPQAHRRHLAGAPAGVRTVFVKHSGNTTASSEEADEIVRQVKAHIGLAWDNGDGRPPRPLGAEDVLVVAPYNAQVNLLRNHLAKAGLTQVRVGTVDRFQGQEAPVVLVSMACSAASEAPRGVEFLINRNRINVAVSRGQWRAVIVRSPELTHYLPTKPAHLEELGAFIGLCNPEYAWKA